MKVIKTMRPQDRGARRFIDRYGKRLCAVRYRSSDCGTRVFTTVEVIVDERPRTPQGVNLNAVHAYRLQQAVALRIAFSETEMRQAVKAAGGKWSRQLQAWITTRDKAIVLGLSHRIEEGLAENCRDLDISFEI